jgi:tRNA threonylcarbamoyladenosine biosynthesis protein TsaB
MYSLFLDTTAGLTYGLLDEKFSWLAYESSNEKRPSEHIHEKIFFMLSKLNIQLSQIRIITLAGPGSYTGMRLSEGFADIAEWNGVKVFSFYHFEIPKLTGVLSGRWITNAFKNEIFSFQWDEIGEKKELLSTCDDPSAFTIEMTAEHIYKYPEVIFSKVILQNEKRETYYFRTLEKEFG